MANLDEEIQIIRKVVAVTPEDRPDRAGWLNNLGDRLINRYLRTGAVTDLEEAIQVTRQATNATLEDHPDRAAFLHNLGICLSHRYSRKGAIDDLEEALRVTRKAVHATPEDRPYRAGWLINLGNCLGDRYLRMGALDDLEEAIQATQKAVGSIPENHPERAGRLNNLGNRLGDRYLRTGALADLEEAILATRKAVDATPKDHPNRAACLNNLGICLMYRYLRKGAIDDLEEVLRVTRKAVHATPENHPDRAAWLNNLGNNLSEKFLITGEMAVLEEAIQVTQKAVDASPEDHPDRAGWLNNLGTYLNDRYSRTGVMLDLKEAIEVARKAISVTVEDHPDRAAWLSNLGCSLGDRYLATGALADLEEAIHVARKAVGSTLENHPERAGRLNNLGNRLGDRYLRTGALADLEEAILATRKAVDATPKDHPNRAAWFNNLGNYLSNRYSKIGTMVDLEEAIQLTRTAVDITPEHYPDYAKWMNNLGGRLADRYSKTGAISNLEEAIQVIRKAVDITPENHPDRAACLKNLGICLGNRYLKTETMADVQEAVRCHQSSLMSIESPISIRILAGIQLLRLCALVSDWKKGSKYSTVAVNLASMLNARSLENSDKQHRLSQIVGLACDASAASLNAGSESLVALNLLERGRGLLAASLDEMRTDILDLRVEHPELASRFTGLRNELQTPATVHIPSPEQSRTPVSKTDRRHLLGSELDSLISEIQQQSGFEDFLRPPSEEEILDASKHGSIVVVNVSEYRCDAILVDQHQIWTVPLPNLTLQEVKEKAQQGNLRSPQTLKWLWDAVAFPILDALGFKEPPLDDDWSHVWWIPTGPLSKFPLHAAGYHGQGSNRTVLDRVMSSYSSSVKTIIRGRRRRTVQDAPKPPAQALLVALQDTPYQGRLDFAARESKMLYDLCRSSNAHPVQPKKHKKDIVSLLPSCTIFHFAGHGHTDNDDPSQSSLLLEDWQSDPLTVANLLEMNLREHAPFLAYLSACGTGEIRDGRFFDESIHLVSACQLAGFRHVIGTLWEVNDESCVDMAEFVYKEIMLRDMTDQSVCTGLHKGTRKLRDRWLGELKGVKYKRRLARRAESGIVDSEVTNSRDKHDTKLPRKVALDDSEEEEEEEESGPLYWVPYVHFGV